MSIFYRHAISTAALVSTLFFSGQVLAQSGDASVPVFRIAGPAAITSNLIPATLESFARENDLTLRREVQGDDSFALALVGADAGFIARFEFLSASSGAALAALSAGSVSLAATNRAASDEELSGLGADPIAQLVGRDALVAIAPREGDIGSISPELLAAVVAGDADDWSDLGGEPGPIELHLPDRTSGLGAVVATMLIAGGAFVDGAVTHGSAVDLVDAVTQNPGSLGVTRFSEIGNARALSLAGQCGLDLAPRYGAIKNGDYPLSMPLFLYGKSEDMHEVLRAYFDHLGSSAVQGPIRLAGFVDRLPESTRLEEMGGTLAHAISIAGVQSPVSELRRFVDALSGFSRLSVTFRFVPGTQRLDAASRSSSRLLARALRAGFFNGDELIFVGYSDGVGASAANLEVGRSRARAVEKAVRALAGDLDSDVVTLRNNSFGETLPLACDDTEWGRMVNRRVEVWID